MTSTGTVTSSDDSTREFELLYEAIRVSLEGDLKGASNLMGSSRCAPHARSIGRISLTGATSLCHRMSASVRGHSSRRTLVFSPEATAVFDAGRELWRYYHAQPHANPNASYYDIRAHFQGRNDKEKMNAKSEDAEYMRLLGTLKEAMEALRLQIVPKENIAQSAATHQPSF